MQFVKYMEKGKDKYGLRLLYHRNYPTMLRYGIKLVGDKSLVEDVIQSLFLKLFEKKLNIQDHPAPDAYIVKSFRRELLRQNKGRIRITGESIPVHIQFSPEDFIIMEEESNASKSQTAELLNTLTDRQKEIVLLHYFESKSYQEIADILDMNYQSVLNNLQRSFRKIRKEFPGGFSSDKI